MNTASGPPPRLHWQALLADNDIAEAALRTACRRRRFARGETILHAGDPAGAMHFLESGLVAIRLGTPLGDDTIVDLLRPGDTFGEQALLEHGAPRTASATALAKTETLSLDARGFADLLEQHQRADRYFLELLAARLHETTQLLLEARYESAERRLYLTLVRLIELFSGDSACVIPLTQADVAAMAGIQRSTANRFLRSAQRDAVLTMSRGRIAVNDAAAVRRRAGLR